MSSRHACRRSGFLFGPACAAALAGMLLTTPALGQYHMEHLDRGLIAVNNGKGDVYVGWRMLGTDPSDIAFNLYRSTNGSTPVKLNGTPLTASTNFVDASASLNDTNSYFARPVVGGRKLAASKTYTLQAHSRPGPVLSIPLQPIPGRGPTGARLAGVGDLDGDGAYDFLVKRGNDDIDPSQSTHPSGSFVLEAYSSQGQMMWRQDLGPNIRSGIWYSPVNVYDLDGDGVSEVIAKTAPASPDYSTPDQGRVLTGPEYFTVFDGKTGNAVASADWIDRREVSDWGDSYGNRVNRNLMTVAYLDGQQPTLINLRGTYTDMYAEAWNYRDGKLEQVWTWDNQDLGPAGQGQGFHNVRVADVDGDGRQELINGSIAIDDDGSTLWSTGQGHGDRMHLSDILPDRPGLEVFYVQEDDDHYDDAVHLRDAATGELIWGHGDGSWGDVGRGLSADIDPRYAGMESWGSRGELYAANGEAIGERPRSVNMGIWWDGDLLRELLDGNHVDKWDYERAELDRLFTARGAEAGSRNAPMGYADILGDWREEFWLIEDGALNVYTTTIPTDLRFYTLMHDPAYRMSVVQQMMGYMQATQPGFFMGVGMEGQPPAPISLPEPGSGAAMLGAAAGSLLVRPGSR